MAGPDGGMTDEILRSVAADIGSGPCLVALGGGADSAVLLWAAVEALGVEGVRGVFIYHGLAGSDMLRSAARANAEHIGVRCEVVMRIVPDGSNLEARARDARYEAIEGMLSDGEVALTGHTADDQAETAMMRFLRGSGSGAIGGIARSRGPWRRPLLEASRAELRALAEELGLPFADDPANEDQRFMRARIRHSVMPVAEAKCGPDVAARIRKSASLLAADDALLETQAAGVPVLCIPEGLLIPAAALVTVAGPVASRVVRRALRVLLDGDAGTMADVEAVISVARGGPAISISNGWQVSAEPPFVTLHTPEPPEPASGFGVIVGESFIWDRSTYTVSHREPWEPIVSGGRFIVLAARIARDGFAVRGLQPGDRIAIEAGSTPVRELLRAAGVPPRRRPGWLAVTVDGKIAALMGVRVAPWARAIHGEPAVVIEREVGT